MMIMELVVGDERLEVVQELCQLSGMPSAWRGRGASSRLLSNAVIVCDWQCPPASPSSHLPPSAAVDVQ